jgi:hypothetical protein
MVDNDERARVEGRPFFRYSGIYFRQNQTSYSNIEMKTRKNQVIQSVSFLFLLDVGVDQRLRCGTVRPHHNFRRERWEN